MPLICQTCESPFSVRPYRATTAKFCSTKCQTASLRKSPSLICLECQQTKGSTDFYVDNTKPRGRVARCKQCYQAKAKAYRLTSPSKRYSEIKRNAVKRKFAFTLTFQQFLDWIWAAPCFYCGVEGGPIGIDRLNNEPFYDMSNSVACCGPCNSMKSDLSMSQFFERIRMIAKQLSLTGDIPPVIANASIALGGKY